MIKIIIALLINILIWIVILCYMVANLKINHLYKTLKSIIYKLSLAHNNKINMKV